VVDNNLLFFDTQNLALFFYHSVAENKIFDVINFTWNEIQILCALCVSVIDNNLLFLISTNYTLFFYHRVAENKIFDVINFTWNEI
jgi:hypothetical protein